MEKSLHEKITECFPIEHVGSSNDWTIYQIRDSDYAIEVKDTKIVVTWCGCYRTESEKWSEIQAYLAEKL